MIVALILIAYWPGMTLFTPRLFGYKDSREAALGSTP